MIRPESETGLKEQEPFSGRTVLITGGATGLGKDVAMALGDAGADLIIGTRSNSNFVSVREAMPNTKLTPFVVDLTRSDMLVRQLDNLESAPTDLILSAAGGMESFSREFALRLVRVAKTVDIGKKKDLLRGLDAFVEEKVRNSEQSATQINWTGNIELVIEFHKRFPGASIIFFSSIPSSFIGKGHEPPDFYRSVAESKGAFEHWMQTAGALDGSAEMTIISGGVIEDSVVGKLIAKYIVPMLSEEERQRLAQGYIRSEDMVQATLQVMNGEVVRGSENPKKLYVTGRGKIVDEVEEDDSVFAFNDLDFADIAARL